MYSKYGPFGSISTKYSEMAILDFSSFLFEFSEQWKMWLMTGVILYSTEKADLKCTIWTLTSN